MGTFLAFAAAFTFSDPKALAGWKKLRVESTDFEDWPSGLEAAGLEEPDDLTIAKLLAAVGKKRFAGGKVLVRLEARASGATRGPASGATRGPASGATRGASVTIAGGLDEGDGLLLWAPALVAATRRAGDAGASGRALLSFAEEGTVTAIGLAAGGSELDALEDDAAHAEALASPELAAAFEVYTGGRDTLDDVPVPAPPAPVKGKKAAKVASGRPPAVSPKWKVKWTPLSVPTTVRLYGVTRAPNDRVWIVGEKGTVFAGLVRDDTWRAIDVGTTSDLSRVVAAPDGTIWIAGADGTLLRGDDGGAVWSSKSPIPGSSHAVGGVAAFGDVVVAVDSEGLVHRSEDRGERWSVVPVAPHPKADAAAPRWGLIGLARGAGDSLYAVGYGGIVLVSDDLGRTFHTRVPGPAPALASVACGDGDVWVVGMDRLLRGAEGLEGPLVYAGPKRERDATFSDVSIADGTVWVSHWAMVLRSYDRGETWEKAHDLRSLVANAIVALGKTEAIIVGSRGLAMACRDR